MKAFTYNGVDVKLEADGRFYVPDAGLGGGAGTYFETAAAARQRVDYQHKRDAKKAAVKLDLAVLNAEGKSLKAKGVHARDGHVLTEPSMGNSSYNRPALYVDDPHVASLLEGRRSLQQQLNELNEKLKAFKLQDSFHDDGENRYRSGANDPDKLHQTSFEKLVADYEAKKKNLPR